MTIPDASSRGNTVHSARRRWAAAILVAAVAAALVPLPRPAVERFYSQAAYLVLQRTVTAFSNRAPFALFDVLLVAVGAAWLAFAALDIVRAPRGRAWRSGLRIAGRTAVLAATCYLLFLLAWGLNYRRVPLSGKLGLDPKSVTTEAARRLAFDAVVQVNELHGPAHASGWPAPDAIDPLLADAFARVQRELGASRIALAGRPKRTLLDLYFRRAAVEGMTDPYFLETLVASDLLPLERPFVVAHEWAHLAGFADEGEANFVGWLTCMRSVAANKYSAWLFIYAEVGRGFRGPDRAELAARLAAGPREDLRAIGARNARNISPRVSAAGWRVYDQYLKSNRVEAGAASYGQVVQLILGTEFGRTVGTQSITR